MHCLCISPASFPFFSLPLPPLSLSLSPPKSTDITSLLKRAYQKYGYLTNQHIVELRRNVFLRVVQQLQDSMSKTAVRSVLDDAFFEKDELAALHRVFYAGCMRVSARLVWGRVLWLSPTLRSCTLRLASVGGLLGRIKEAGAQRDRIFDPCPTAHALGWVVSSMPPARVNRRVARRVDVLAHPLDAITFSPAPPGCLGKKIFDLLAEDGKVSFPAFAHGLGVICKGNLNARLAFLVKMHRLYGMEGCIGCWDRNPDLC